MVEESRRRAVTDGGERVQDEWLRRVEAEYRSAAVTQQLTLWLIQMGASPDLIDAGLVIVSDELTHARMAQEVYLAAGGRGRARLARESLGLERHASEPLELDVLRACADLFCLHETVAVPLFRALRDGAIEPPARRALDRVLVDEVRHRDFGWTLLAWLLGGPDAEAHRRLVERELPSMMRGLIGAYARPLIRAEGDGHAVGGDQAVRNLETENRPQAKIPAGDRAWGLMESARYGEILRATVERDYVPRFARVGIDARAAWTSALEDTRIALTDS